MTTELNTETLDFTLDEVFDVPGGKITLLNGDGFAGLELIESSHFETGLYSIGMDVEDINEEIRKLEEKGADIALKPVETQVGYMARVAGIEIRSIIGGVILPIWRWFGVSFIL